MTFWPSLYVHSFPGLFMLWLAVCYRIYLRFKYPQPRKMTKEEQATLLAATTRKAHHVKIY
jgi:cytochrome b561